MSFPSDISYSAISPAKPHKCCLAQAGITCDSFSRIYLASLRHFGWWETKLGFERKEGKCFIFIREWGEFISDSLGITGSFWSRRSSLSIRCLRKFQSRKAIWGIWRSDIALPPLETSRVIISLGHPGSFQLPLACDHDCSDTPTGPHALVTLHLSVMHAEHRSLQCKQMRKYIFSTTTKSSGH